MFKDLIIFSTFFVVLFVTNASSFLFSYKEKCQITAYKGGKDFSGSAIMTNKSFQPYLKSIGAVARECKVRVHVTDSYKQLKSPTEYVLLSQMPLALGHGIHFNLEDQKGSVLCNRVCMTSGAWKTLPEATCFIEGVQKKGIQFASPNLLHDGFARKLSSSEVEALKVATQKLCATKSKETKG